MALLNSKADGTRIKARYDDGKRMRSRFDSRVDLLAPYIEPTRSNVLTDQSPGAALMARTYDSEGIYAADLAVKEIGGYLHGPGSVWFSLQEEREELNREDDVREWLEESRDRMLKDLAASNFYADSFEADMDWIGFGTNSMKIEENPMLPYLEEFGYRGTRFHVDKIGRFVIYENARGEVDELYSEHSWNAQRAVDLFGEKNVPEKVLEALRQNNRTQQFKFVHGIYPRPQGEKGKTQAERMPFASTYIHYDSAEVVREGGYEEYPAVNTRWLRCFGEPYGRGLGEIALNNLITLNTHIKFDTEGLALAIKRPLLQRHDAVIGAKRLKPWGVTTVRVPFNSRLEEALRPLDMGSDFRRTQVKADELRQSIRRIFWVDMLQQLMALEGQQEMRVYVFQQKQNIANKLLAPVYGRWESEFGNPMIGRYFNLLLRRGVFSPPPDILLEQGGRLNVRFESPLARAQRNEAIQAMQAAMADILPIAEAQFKLSGRTDILDNYDFDKFAMEINRNHSVPATIVRSAKEVAILRKSRAEAEAEAQMGQEAMMVAEGMGKAAPALKLLQDRKAA